MLTSKHISNRISNSLLYDNGTDIEELYTDYDAEDQRFGIMNEVIDIEEHFIKPDVPVISVNTYKCSICPAAEVYRTIPPGWQKINDKYICEACAKKVPAMINMPIMTRATFLVLRTIIKHKATCFSKIMKALGISAGSLGYRLNKLLELGMIYRYSKYGVYSATKKGFGFVNVNVNVDESIRVYNKPGRTG